MAARNRDHLENEQRLVETLLDRPLLLSQLSTTQDGLCRPSFRDDSDGLERPSYMVFNAA